MIQLKILGSMALTGSDQPAGPSVFSQPKRLALLSYLAVAYPSGFCRRDTLLGLFWPNSSQGNGRAALSTALSFLRKALGEGIILRRGTEEVGVDPAVLGTDVLSFERAIQSRELETALEIYRGHLMEGFFLSGCPAFEQWLEEEREQLRELAAVAAWDLAHEQVAGGKPTEGEHTAQKALRLRPTDESRVRSFIEALAEGGDRAAAVQFFEKFCGILREELDLEPSGETKEIVTGIRASTGPSAQTLRSRSMPSEYPASEPTGSPPRAGLHRGRKVRRPSSYVLLGSVLILGTAVATWSIRGFRTGGSSDSTENRVAVVPFENLTGDPALDILEVAVLYDISRGLRLLSGITVVDPTAVRRRLSSVGADVSVAEMGRKLRAKSIITGMIMPLGSDSLQVQLEITSTSTETVVHSLHAAGSLNDPGAVVDDLREQAVAALAVTKGSAVERRITRPPSNLEAYSAFLRGVETFYAGDLTGSLPHFQRASQLDSTFYDPQYFIVSANQNLGRYARADSVLQAMERRQGELSEADLLRFESQRAVQDGDLESWHRAIRAQFERDPASYGYRVANSALQTRRPREALDALNGFDFDDPYYGDSRILWSRLSWAYYLTGDFEKALASAREGLQRLPDNILLVDYELQALAGLGRLEEAKDILDRLETLEPQGIYDPGGTLLRAAVAFARHGHEEEAPAIAERAYRWYHRQNPDAYVAGEAQALIQAHRPDEALTILSAGIRANPENLAYHGLYGIALAQTGDADGAEAEETWLKQLDRPYMRGRHKEWRASILAALGEKESATRLVRQARSEGTHHFAMYLFPFFEPLWGYEPFEQLMAARG